MLSKWGAAALITVHFNHSAFDARQASCQCPTPDLPALIKRSQAFHVLTEPDVCQISYIDPVRQDIQSISFLFNNNILKLVEVCVQLLEDEHVFLFSRNFIS